MHPTPLKFDAMVKKLWESNWCRKWQADTKHLWLYDGRKLAWCARDFGEQRITIDLDNDLVQTGDKRYVEPKTKKVPKIGRDGKPRNAVWTLVVRKTTTINMSVLPGYLSGRVGWCEALLEAMSESINRLNWTATHAHVGMTLMADFDPPLHADFLDHLIRQKPSEIMTRIKRNFFNVEARVQTLDTFLDVFKGTYASIRMNESINRGGLGLGINVDVANTAFWKELQLPELMCRYLAWLDRRKYGTIRPENLADALRPIRLDNGSWGASEAFKHLRKLSKLRFTVRHRGTSKEEEENGGRKSKVYIISGFEFGQQYGAEGGNARTVTFDWNGTQTSVAEYFQKNWNHMLRFPGMPLVTTTRAGHFPAEVCTISHLERYPYKLDAEQTSKMIKFAVTRPDQRKADIMSGREKLGWETDPYMKQFGLEMDTKFASVDARIMPNPEIRFGNGKHNPGTTGRWDLRGKTFFQPNLVPLKAWGFVIVERSVQLRVLQEFANTFHKQYVSHGGRIEQKPLIIDQGNQTNVAVAVEQAYRQVFAKFGGCQFLFIVLRAKNTGSYERIKKSADCRFGMLTQCVQAVHVEKNQLQYHSNVAMKVNAKLGGVTCRVPHPTSDKAPFFEEPTIILGADVSHAAPGSAVASMAALTMSINADATRYAAACDTNGHRVEMLTPTNVQTLMGRLIQSAKKAGMPAPKHVYYFRDGVAESQYIHVLNQEVRDLKNWFKANTQTAPKFTVVIATKRHHIRFFPQRGAGDRNNNPLPGTLIETEVTHPFQWDFYLCSHVAIQGTARPVHYTVILDEANCQPNKLQAMIYSHCYAYIRSTTPVSLHPAVYYAHLASNRARFHENIGTDDGGFRSGGKAVEVQHEALAKRVHTLEGIADEAEENAKKRLMALGGSQDTDPRNRDLIRNTMWYI